MIGNSLFSGQKTEWTALDAEKDAVEVASWTVDEDFVLEFMEKPARPFAVHEIKKKLKDDLKAADEKRNAFIFAVRRKGTEDLIGLIRFSWFNPTQQEIRLFLNFSSSQILNEYGEEVLNMALRYGFMELSLHRLWLEVPSYAAERIKLFEAAGFLREIQRRECVFHNGQYHDQLVYSILKPEWKKIRQMEVTA